MNRVSFGLALCVLAAGTAAGAQTAGGITNIQSSAGTTATVGSDSSPVSFGAGAGSTGVGPSGSDFNSYVSVTPQAITFESENTGSGDAISTTSFSQVSFTVNNNTGQAATFSSTITAAGLGFYLADVSSGCLYTQCPQIESLGDTTFESLSNNFYGSVGFEFTVSRQGSNDLVPLYSLIGSLGLSRDGNLFDNDNLGDFGDGETDPSGPRGVLDGFTEARGNDFDPQLGIGAATGWTYAWDATDFSFDIGSQASQTLVYSTRVYSNANSACIEGTSICLIAYSGFGDPVGRGGGNDAAFARGFSTFSLIPDNGRINGLTFSPQVFAIPTFEDGVVTYRASGAVPEPATWISMIFGFGLLGAILRRRRSGAAVTA